jgi:hypothetical protein
MNNSSIGTKHYVNKISIVIYIGVLVVLRILYGGYTFGLSDSIDHLPLVYRMIDPSYLSYDFRINMGDLFGPRYYFSRVLSGLATFIPLYTVFFLSTVLVITFIAIITYKMSKLLVAESKPIIPLVSVLLVLTITPVYEFGDLVSDYLKPSFLTKPLAFACIFFAFKRKPVLSAIFGSIAAIFHPTLGLETVAFAFLIEFIFIMVRIKNKELDGTKNILHAMTPLFISVILVLLFFLAFWVLPYMRSLNQFKLEETRFLEIILFRTSRTTLPSAIPIKAYLSAGMLLPVFFLLLIKEYRRDHDTKVLAILGMLLTLVIVCIIGLLFAKSSRLWVTARPCRMLFLLAWLAIILIPFLVSRNKSSIWIFLTALILSAFSYILGQARLIPLLILSSFFILYLALSYHNITNRTRFAVLASFSLFIAADAVFNIVTIKPLDKLRPKLSLQTDLNDDAIEIANFVAANTPENAVFLTPPDFGSFRLIANRAIVADWKSMPFQDIGMDGWWERMQDCYGVIPETDRKKINTRMYSNYREISDSTLEYLSQKYGITYAVLYSQTQTGYRLVFASKDLKLVSLASE